jgi:hypothetical protein
MDAADYVIAPLIEPRVEEGNKDRTMVLNMGPQHPSTHGVLRLVLEIDGETVVRLVPDIGFLHTGIEKTCEAKFFQQVVPLTDRIDYLSPMSNNLCYCLAVEKLLQLEIPPRAQFLRVLLNELTRLQSHLVWLGTHAMDIGALTLFLYTFREREEILKIFEDVSGQRMMGSYFRIGGLALEPPVDFYERVQALLKMSTRTCSTAIPSGPAGSKELATSAPPMPWPWESPGHPCGPVASIGTCAATCPTRATKSFSSRYLSPTWAMSGPATPCAFRKCGNRSRSASRHSTECPRVPSRPTLPKWSFPIAKR